MLHIFHGRDDFSQREALAALREGLDSDGMLASNTTIVDGRTVTPEELLALCQTVPFLSSHRLIVVEGLLGRFDWRERRGRRGRPRRGEELGPWRAAAEGLARLPESTTLVLLEGDVSQNNPLLGLLAPAADVREFRPLPRGDVAAWIARRAAGLGLAIAPRAVALLASLGGSDLWTLSRELEKLAAYADGRQVEEEDVRTLVSAVREASVFAAADALIEGRTKDALAIVRRHLTEGAAPQGLLAVLTRHYRHLVLARGMLAAGAAPAQIGARLDVPSFAAERILRWAPRYSPARLREAYRRLLDADLSIKRGLCDDETALLLLVEDLGRLAPAAARPASRPGGRQG